MRRSIARLGSERDGEIVAQRIDDDDDGFAEGLGLPAAGCGIADGMGGLEVGGGFGAEGAVGEDEAGEEEAGGEEVDAEGVKDAVGGVTRASRKRG